MKLNNTDSGFKTMAKQRVTSNNAFDRKNFTNEEFGFDEIRPKKTLGISQVMR